MKRTARTILPALILLFVGSIAVLAQSRNGGRSNETYSANRNEQPGVYVIPGNTNERNQSSQSNLRNSYYAAPQQRGQPKFVYPPPIQPNRSRSFKRSVGNFAGGFVDGFTQRSEYAPMPGQYEQTGLQPPRPSINRGLGVFLGAVSRIAGDVWVQRKYYR